jgi:hypothetical protein
LTSEEVKIAIEVMFTFFHPTPSDIYFIPEKKKNNLVPAECHLIPTA